MSRQHIRRCAGCEQWRHVSAFRPYAVLCRSCEDEAAFEAEGRSWEDEQIERARDYLVYTVTGRRHFDLGASFRAAEERRTVAAVERILDGKRPKVIPLRNWRLVKLRGAGRTIEEAAGMCRLTAERARELERQTMIELLARARMDMTREDNAREARRG